MKRVNQQEGGVRITVILRLPDVKAITGLSRSSIYAMMKNGNFPKSVKLSARSVGWVENQVTGFLESRIAASNGVGKEAA